MLVFWPVAKEPAAAVPAEAAPVAVVTRPKLNPLPIAIEFEAALAEQMLQTRAAVTRNNFRIVVFLRRRYASNTSSRVRVETLPGVKLCWVVTCSGPRLWRQQGDQDLHASF